MKCKDDRELCHPLALFYTKKTGELLPIAIQLFQQPAEDNPVFLPSDPTYTWMLAKMYYNNADAAVHQACTHLGRWYLTRGVNFDRDKQFYTQFTYPQMSHFRAHFFPIFF